MEGKVMENTETKEKVEKLKKQNALIVKIEKNEKEIAKLEKALAKAKAKQEELFYEFETGQKLPKSKGEKVGDKGASDE